MSSPRSSRSTRSGTLQQTRLFPLAYPRIEVVQGRPEWDDLREAALSAGQVFARRGTLPEDHEVP